MILKDLFRTFRIITGAITVYFAPCNTSKVAPNAGYTKYDPLNNPILLCMLAMDAFTPVVYDGCDCFVVSKELANYLGILNQEHGLLEKIGENGKVNEMIAYLTAYCHINTKNKLFEALKTIIALSRGELYDTISQGKLHRTARHFIAPGGKSIVFEMGTTTHSMKGEIIMSKSKPGNFIFNVYNSAGGIECHSYQQSSKSRRIKYAPYLSFAATEPDLNENFANLLSEIHAFEGHQDKYFKGKPATIKDLYVSTLATIFLQRKTEKYKDFISPQRAGSCTLSSWHSFFTAKFGNYTYKKIRFAIVIGIMQRQLNSPEFDFLNHDYSESRKLDYDFHIKNQIVRESEQKYSSSLFSKHFEDASYRKDSPKRTTKRDAVMAYEQIIRWLHRQNEKIFGDPGKMSQIPERRELLRRKQEISRHHALFKENIETIEKLFKTKKDAYLAEIDAANRAKKVAFEFLPIGGLGFENADSGNKDREILARYNKAIGSQPVASCYFVCTWGSMDDFVDSCDMFIKIRQTYRPVAKENSLYLASYLYHFSDQVSEATKRWGALPAYKERIGEILGAIHKLGAHILDNLAFNKRDTAYIDEFRMAYSGLINAYFSTWKYYYVNVANAGIDTSGDIKYYEDMMKSILMLPRSSYIDLTGKERSEGDIKEYCFYSKGSAECPEASSKNRIKLENLMRCGDDKEREGIAAELFQAARQNLASHQDLKLEEDACPNGLRDALTTAVLVATDWMLKSGEALRLTKIDGHYYKLLDMVRLFNKISDRNNIKFMTGQYTVEVNTGSSGIEKMSSSGLFGLLPFENYRYSRDADIKLAKSAMLNIEGYLKNPRTLVSHKAWHDLYRYILDRNRMPGDADLEEYRRRIEILNAICKTKLEGLKIKTGRPDRESSLRIIALCFLVSKRMKASMKDSLENIGDDTENLTLGSVDFIQGLVSEKKGQKELEYLFTFLEAAGETIDRSKNDAFARHSKKDISLIIKIHNIISKNLGILEKYVHQSELFAFIPRFYESHLESINEFEVENGEEFDFYPYSIQNCDVLEPPDSFENLPDNPVSISYFGDVDNLHQQVDYKDVTFIVNGGCVFCIFRKNGVDSVRRIQSSIMALCYSKERVNLSPLFGSREKLYFVDSSLVRNVSGDEMRYYIIKIMLKGGCEYGKIFRRGNDDQYYFELTDREAFCLNGYDGDAIFRIGIPSLKERVIENCYDETCVRNLPLIDNFAQGTDVLTLLESDGNGDSFHFLPIYSSRDNGTCDCFIHCSKARQEYDLYFKGRRYSILDIHEDGAGNVSIENRKYYELPILFVKLDNSNEEIDDKRVFMVCPTSLIQDDQPGSGDMDAPKLVFIECNSNFVPAIRDTFHAALLFRMCLEYKMYVEALECLLQINLFAAGRGSMNAALILLGRSINYNNHRDIEACFFKAFAAHILEAFHARVSANVSRPSWFLVKYRNFESIHSLLPSYLQCLSQSFIDFQDQKLSRIFMYCKGELAIFKNSKGILRGGLEKSLKMKISQMLDSAKGHPSPLSNELVDWVQQDLACKGHSPENMPVFMRNLKNPDSLKNYCSTTFIERFYDGDIYKSIIDNSDIQSDPESTILCVSTKRESMKSNSGALYTELYNAAKEYLEAGSDKPDDDKSSVMSRALKRYWEKEIAKIQDPLLLSGEEVADYLISLKYHDRFNREANKLFREDLNLEVGEDSTIRLEDIVAQAEPEYGAIEKSIDMKFSMDSLLKDKDDFLRKRLSQRILLGMSAKELKRYFKVKDAESLYRAIWSRFIEENQGRSVTVRKYAAPGSRTLSMIDKIIVSFCGHAENDTNVINVVRCDEEALRHIIGQLEKDETSVQYRSANINKLRVLVPCLALYATHKLQKIPIIVLSHYATDQDMWDLQAVLKRAFGKSVFRVQMTKSNGEFRIVHMFTILILLRNIRIAGDVIACTPGDIQSFQTAWEEMQQDQTRYKVELKLITEILRVFRKESLGILDGVCSVANLCKTVRLPA